MFLLHGCSLLLLMERAEDSDGDDRPKPNSLADKIKKIDVPIKGILKKPIILSDSRISSNQSVIGKETNFWEEDNIQNLNHKDLSKPDNCPKQVRDELKVNKGKGKHQVDDDGFTMVGNKKKANKKGVVIKEKPKFEYRPVSKQNNNPIDRPKPSNIQPTVKLGNPFSCLGSSSGSRENDESDYDEVIEGQALLLRRFQMSSIACWNIRGLGRPLKQREVRDFINDNKIQVCAILESHVDVSNLLGVCNNICRKWNWSSNGDICSKGTRILLGWNSDCVDVMVLSQTPQVIHVQIVFKEDKKAMYCSFIYASNDYIIRRHLWESLNVHKAFVSCNPWIIMGDFNSALSLEDKAMGSSKISTGMKDFNECVEKIEVSDVNSMGFHYTWTQKPKKGIGILKKIDRIMANLPFMDAFPSSCAIFHPYRVSDHSPCVLKLPSIATSKPKPFKFPNFLAYKKEFSDLVKEEWGKNVNGVHMFKVVKKLRTLKHPIRSLFVKQGNLHNRVKSLRNELDTIQNAVDVNPTDADMRILESDLLAKYQEAMLDEERFLKQKSKVHWLKVGDSNSSFFHNSLKTRNHRSRIDIIKDSFGNVFEGNMAANAIVDHFQNFLGQKGTSSRLPMNDLFQNKIQPHMADNMIREIID
ncbi:hypothetical protein L1987_83365 [Smallanthus sonchifolius]|uniref:Uncharacterized protein n=1 Tax=Smallanthus sonchifolius TaxID=185202 RepID=A0ACB8YC67_9ASTR|nr:hypothetical protein L1987_83365 [Smallanthus sonchifolius]